LVRKKEIRKKWEADKFIVRLFFELVSKRRVVFRWSWECNSHRSRLIRECGKEWNLVRCGFGEFQLQFHEPIWNGMRIPPL
jgi:hypothetical protein